MEQQLLTFLFHRSLQDCLEIAEMVRHFLACSMFFDIDFVNSARTVWKAQRVRETCSAQAASTCVIQYLTAYVTSHRKLKYVTVVTFVLSFTLYCSRREICILE